MSHRARGELRRAFVCGKIASDVLGVRNLSDAKQRKLLAALTAAYRAGRGEVWK